MNGYRIFIWTPGTLEPPSGNSSYVYEHREVAAKQLGRRLKPEETVHHMDEVRDNNSLDNLRVFRTQADHSRYHKTGVMVDMGDGTWTSPEIDSIEHYCLCGKLKCKISQECLDCYKKRQAKRIPSREELERLVWSKPTTHIAEDFGVSDKAVSKWCKSLGVEKPPRGYWRKIETNMPL